MKEGFCVGDSVAIRDWDDMEQEYGLTDNDNIDCQYTFVRDMEHFCGTECTILYMNDHGGVKLDIDQEGFNFSTDMIRHVDDSPDYEVDLGGFLAVLQ